MAQSEPTYLTAEGAEKLRAELADLKGPQREALSRRLRDAIQMGDLSENADYIKAKEDQGFVEGHIQELEYILNNAVIVEESTSKREVVFVGATVTIQEADFEPEVFYIVGAKEANPRAGKISHESPYGRALMEHHVGDVVDVDTPGGKIRLKILEIN